MILWQKLCIIVYVSLPCCTLCCATHCKFKHFVSYFLKPTVLDLCSSRHLWEWKKKLSLIIIYPMYKKKESNSNIYCILNWEPVSFGFRCYVDIYLYNMHIYSITSRACDGIFMILYYDRYDMFWGNKKHELIRLKLWKKNKNE